MIKLSENNESDESHRTDVDGSGLSLLLYRCMSTVPGTGSNWLFFSHWFSQEELQQRFYSWNPWTER